jgi:RNA polymerase sigma-70 factor (ECF subfamily)
LLTAPRCGVVPLRTGGAMSDDRVSALYRTYGPVIYARCMRLLADRALAEDATQETFMRVHRHLARAPDTDEVLAWIYRIATNYCLNEIRNRKRRPEPQAELPERGDATAADVATLLADRDLVVRLIDHCPEKLRVVAWLHHVDGLDQGEVARVLDVSRRTAVSRLAEFAERAQRFIARAAS